MADKSAVQHCPERHLMILLACQQLPREPMAWPTLDEFDLASRVPRVCPLVLFIIASVVANTKVICHYAKHKPLCLYCTHVSKVSKVHTIHSGILGYSRLNCPGRGECSTDSSTRDNVAHFPQHAHDNGESVLVNIHTSKPYCRCVLPCTCVVHPQMYLCSV